VSKISLNPLPNGTISYKQLLKINNGKRCGPNAQMSASNPDRQLRVHVTSKRYLGVNTTLRGDENFRELRGEE